MTADDVLAYMANLPNGQKLLIMHRVFLKGTVDVELVQEAVFGQKQSIAVRQFRCGIGRSA